MTKQTTRKISERDLVKSADNAIKVEEFEKSQIIGGQPLPEDFENPDPGKPGHKCVDIDGNYQPLWTALHIHRTSDDTPERQFFACGIRSWRVRTGVWVDVPPEIINILNLTVMSEIEMDITKANPLADRGVERVVREIPRFSTSVVPSA
jgi:hypothetical protein